MGYHSAKANQPDHDRRIHHRYTMLKAGTLSPDGRLSVFDCIVHDLSNTGARVKVQAEHTIPDQSVFALNDHSVLKNTRVVWRCGRELGLEFVAVGV